MQTSRPKFENRWATDLREWIVPLVEWWGLQVWEGGRKRFDWLWAQLFWIKNAWPYGVRKWVKLLVPGSCFYFFIFKKTFVNWRRKNTKKMFDCRLSIVDLRFSIFDLRFSILTVFGFYFSFFIFYPLDFCDCEITTTMMVFFGPIMEGGV